MGKATATQVTGEWINNQLIKGSFTDAFGNEFVGDYQGSTQSVGYVAGGTFNLCSGATQKARNPTISELEAELMSFDKDKNGVIDKDELKAILTRPGAGYVAMDDEQASTLLMVIAAIFDKNEDGKV